MLNVLLRLVLIMSSETDINMKKSKLNILCVEIYIKMTDEFQKHLVKNYNKNSV